MTYDDVVNKMSDEQKILHQVILNVMDIEPYYVMNGEEIEAEISCYTNGGVNEVIDLSPFSIKSLEEYVRGFNIDEVIDLYRRDRCYCSAFSVSESLEDFTDFKDKLDELLSAVKEAIEKKDYDKNDKILKEIEELTKTIAEAKKKMIDLAVAALKERGGERDLSFNTYYTIPEYNDVVFKKAVIVNDGEDDSVIIVFEVVDDGEIYEEPIDYLVLDDVAFNDIIYSIIEE